MEISNIKSENKQENYSTISSAIGILTKEQVTGLVTLFGIKPSKGSIPYFEELTIKVSFDTLTNSDMIKLPAGKGYLPFISLIDFMGDNSSDILVVINTGGTRNSVYTYI